MKNTTPLHGVLILLCITLCLTLVSCAGMPKAPQPGDLTGAEQLERIKTLVGTWYPSDGGEDADPIAIYRLSANDNSVVERLFPNQKKEMVTMYFLNDGELTLTHFCALSNQPTMVAEPGKAGEIWFRFKGITNLGDRNNQPTCTSTACSSMKTPTEWTPPGSFGKGIRKKSSVSFRWCDASQRKSRHDSA